MAEEATQGIEGRTGRLSAAIPQVLVFTLATLYLVYRRSLPMVIRILGGIRSADSPAPGMPMALTVSTRQC